MSAYLIYIYIYIYIHIHIGAGSMASFFYTFFDTLLYPLDPSYLDGQD